MEDALALASQPSLPSQSQSQSQSQQPSQTIEQTRESLARANEDLRAIATEVGEHFIRSNQAALEQAETHNQTDLKRYRRKFQTLKNTYINQDVKQRFMQGLDVPDVRADQQQAVLAQLEATLEQQSGSLRELKQQNSALQGQVTDTVKKICAAVEEYKAASTSLAHKIDAALEQYDEHDASKPSMPSPLPAGPGEEECAAQLQREMHDTKELEGRIAAAEAQNADLEEAVRQEAGKVRSAAALMAGAAAACCCPLLPAAAARCCPPPPTSRRSEPAAARPAPARRAAPRRRRCKRCSSSSSAWRPSPRTLRARRTRTRSTSARRSGAAAWRASWPRWAACRCSTPSRTRCRWSWWSACR
jgi:hypothetical protein